MSGCIDCGAPDTPVREARTDGGHVSRVRRCDTCEARFVEWYDRWGASLRRARERTPRRTATTIARPESTVSTGADSRAVALAALEALHS